MNDFTELQIEIENNCLLNCKHCSSVSLKTYPKRGYSINMVEKLIARFKGKLLINLTGGEPQLFNKFNDLLVRLKTCKSDLELGIFTSGITKTKNKISPITLKEAICQKQSGLDSCYISIYDRDPNKHDFITNIRNSLNYSEESIINYIDAGVIVKIHLVLLKNNIESLDDIIRHLDELGVTEVRLLKLSKKGNAEHFWEEIQTPTIQLRMLLKTLHSKNTNNKMQLSIAGFPDIMPCRPFDGAYRCQAGINLFYITYSGNIYPCACVRSDKKYKIGHISELSKINYFIENTNHVFYNDCINTKKIQN